jgi:hypothetical protein
MSDQLPIPWKAPEADLVPASARTPEEFVKYAVALKAAEQQKVISALEAGLHELATEFVWKRALARLKQTLATLGMQFVGEMLGRDDITEMSAPDAVLTDWDAIRLAENLGVVSTTGALRLRHGFELLSHLAQSSEKELDEGLFDDEAVAVIRNCVKYILAEQDIRIAVNFSRFRDRLISETLTKDDPELQTLLGSPPFFLKTALRVLLATIKSEHGARLEHSLSNFSLILPEIWTRITEEDRWAVGTTYAEVANEGKTELVNALRRSLMKVSGFDYVPESLRSNTFKTAAQAVITTHFGMNNFHLEIGPTTTLARLGTVIPKPALIECMQAYLCVYLGNHYGFAWNAAPLAEQELKKISPDRWSYYITHQLAKDDIVLGTLMATSNLPASRFCTLIARLDFTVGEGSEATRLIAAAKANRPFEVTTVATQQWHKLRRNL